MSESSSPVTASATDTDDSPLVCFCHTVSRAKIIAAIRAGATTLEKIKAETCASTGCGGCEPEVKELLEAELAKIQSEK